MINLLLALFVCLNCASYMVNPAGNNLVYNTNRTKPEDSKQPLDSETKAAIRAKRKQTQDPENTEEFQGPW